MTKIWDAYWSLYRNILWLAIRTIENGNGWQIRELSIMQKLIFNLVRIISEVVLMPPPDWIPLILVLHTQVMPYQSPQVMQPFHNEIKNEKMKMFPWFPLLKEM